MNNVAYYEMTRQRDDLKRRLAAAKALNHELLELCEAIHKAFYCDGHIEASEGILLIPKLEAAIAKADSHTGD